MLDEIRWPAALRRWHVSCGQLAVCVVSNGHNNGLDHALGLGRGGFTVQGERVLLRLSNLVKVLFRTRASGSCLIGRTERKKKKEEEKKSKREETVVNYGRLEKAGLDALTKRSFLTCRRAADRRKVFPKLAQPPSRVARVRVA